MPYPAITSRRLPYDIDGTAVARADEGLKIIDWINNTSLIGEANKSEENYVNISLNGDWGRTYFMFFFPELREIEAAYIVADKNIGGQSGGYVFQGSTDTTNGIDGTWETPTYPNGSPISLQPIVPSWRSDIRPVSFSGPIRCLRLYTTGFYNRFHFYGRKAEGQTVDDILLCDINGAELTSLLDWGDRPEATEQIKSIKLKNTSTTKTANGVNLQLNHGDFGMSFNVAGSWTATLDIASIPPNGLSEPIYIKNTVGLPPQTLGPKAGRLIATVGSWT